MSDLISVIIPIYNVKNYMRECIDSVILQTYDNLEIILVDDGSTDESGLICDEYEKKDDRIKVLHKENGGLSDARNEGIKKATGKFITFIDSDDKVALDYCEKLYNELSKNDADIAICNTVLFCNIIPNNISYKDCIVLDKETAISKTLEGKISHTAWGKLYLKKLFDDIVFPKGKTTEDVFVVISILLKVNKVVSGVMTDYYYRQRMDSIQNSKRINAENIIDAHLFNYNLLKESKFEQLAYERYIFAYFDAVNMISRTGKDDERLYDYKKFLKSHYKDIKKSVLMNKKTKALITILFISTLLYRKNYYAHYRRLLKRLT